MKETTKNTNALNRVEETWIKGLHKTLIRYIQFTNKNVEDLYSDLVEKTTIKPLRHIKRITNAFIPKAQQNHVELSARKELAT